MDLGLRLVALAVVTFVVACAHQGPRHPPLARGAPVSVQPLPAVDRLKMNDVVYRKVAEGQTIRKDGTVEVSGYHRQDCAGVRCVSDYVLYNAVIAGVLVASPAILALAAIETSAGKSAQSGNKSIAPTPLQGECPSSEHTHGGNNEDNFAARMKNVLLAEPFLARFDDLYVSGLRRALAGPASPASAIDPPDEDAQRFERAADQPRSRVLSGLSQVALLQTRQPEDFVVVCSRTIVQKADLAPRYFRTCLSKRVCWPKSGMESNDAQWLRDALVKQMQELVVLKARALMGGPPRADAMNIY